MKDKELDYSQRRVTEILLNARRFFEEQHAQKQVLVVFCQWTEIFDRFVPVVRIGELAGAAPRRLSEESVHVGGKLIYNFFAHGRDSYSFAALTTKTANASL